MIVQWMTSLFIEAEKAARSKGSSTTTLPDLLGEIARDHKLANAAQWEDENKTRDGILVRAPEEGVTVRHMHAATTALGP